MLPKLHIIRTPDGVDFPLPSYASKHHVGLVLRAAIPTVQKLDPGERGLVPVGFGIGIPDGLCGQIVSLPQVAKETGLIVLDAPQILNPGDRDALFVLIQNASRRQVILRRGDPIGQLVVTPAYQVVWNEIKGKTLRSQHEPINLDQPVADKKNQSAAATHAKRIVKTVRERTKAADEV